MRVCVSAVLMLAEVVMVLAEPDITVIRQRMTFERDHVLEVNASVEYILDFVPVNDQGDWPSRVWMQSDGGDVAHPLLVTARQREGATTWQLPYSLDGAVLSQQERTLCPEEAARLDAASQNCTGAEAGAGAGAGGGARGWLSLQVGTMCARGATLRLRVSPDRSWSLPFDTPVFVHVLQGAPRVHLYQFEEEQTSVRLVAESADMVCATIAVQPYGCPIADTLDLIETSTVRMTMLQSGAAQFSRRLYPDGFYVISVVHPGDVECREETPEHSDWLWEAAVLPREGEEEGESSPRRTRVKNLSLHIKRSLSRGGYVWGSAWTLALFASFYLLFGAYVLLQRAPRFKRLVAPRAVLAATPAPTIDSVDGAGAQAQAEVDSARAPMRRRGSDATFDSSDISDSSGDEDGDVTTGAAPAPGATRADAGNGHSGENGHNGIYIVDGSSTQVEPPAESPPRPFGLPARLVVAALARRRARVLSARSDRYLYTLYTVGLFYALPVVQFVAAFQIMLNVSGSLDTCYYNFLCAHPAGTLADFNHVYSNIGYLLLGALFMLQVRRRKMRRKRKPRHEEYGIPMHYGLLSSLGAAMMMVALLSATYHVCPNALNFQFDTAFMYVLAVLSMVKIYQARHPDINARAHATFGLLAVLIFLVVWGVLGGGPLFWALFTVLHVFTFLVLSLRIYYVGQFRFEKASLQTAARSWWAGRGLRPLYGARLVLLLIANAVNWAFALYGLFTQSQDFASHLLMVLLANTLLYMVFYLTMKLLHGERLRWYSWAFLASAAAAWAPALYYFLSGSSQWSSTPALSRHRNHECKVLEFYDAHDLWHILSALALYLSCNVMLTWDDGLAAVPRTDIAVF